MAADEPNTDAVMRQALTSALPTDEPPIGLEVGDIMRRGRRRYRARRAVPIAAAAAVAALLVVVPLTMGFGDPPADSLPMGGSTETAAPSPGATSSAPSSTTVAAPPPTGPTAGGGGTSRDEVPSSGETTVAAPGVAGPPFRAPAGHRRDADADALADTVVARMPTEHMGADFGTRSDGIASGGRYGFGFHMLWRENGRYGYLAMLHRTVGDFPASVYGMPAEPCLTPATRRPEYHCVKLLVPDGGVAYSYEIDNGYRVRGIVWDQKDPAGGADIRITGAFFIPEPGAWTPFQALDDGPLLTEIPVSGEQLAEMIGIPG